MIKNFAVVGLLLALASAANAGYLKNDSSAIPGFAGEVNFYSGLGKLDADVQYAVYAPGTFGDGLTADPSGGTQYVYAYQIFNNGEKPVHTFTVGLSGPAFNATVAPLFAAAGGIAPSGFPAGSQGWGIETGSAVATFLDVELMSPFNSQVLLFTSPYAPEFGPASVSDGGRTSEMTLPGPVVPEPAGIAFGALALGALLRRSR